MKNKIKLSLLSIILFTGCSTKNVNTKKQYKKKITKKHWSYSKIDKSRLKKLKRYKVRGSYYKPFIPYVGYQQIGLSSWYGKPFHGRKTASGEIYNMYEYTAAHRNFAINTVVEVTNLSNNKKIKVRINDRGPYTYKGRVIDLSYSAAKKIGMQKKGVQKVKIKVLGYGI
jgi:rare lipoprotein A